jgi:hypothetical protein
MTRSLLSSSIDYLSYLLALQLINLWAARRVEDTFTMFTSENKSRLEYEFLRGSIATVKVDML